LFRSNQEDAMGKLADLFDRDMAIRGLAESTRHEYLKKVRDFVRFLGRSPDQATLDDVLKYQDQMIRGRKVSWSYAKVIAAALKFFFGTTLNKDWRLEDIPYPRRTGRRLPA